jgi:hypothetical protein
MAPTGTFVETKEHLGGFAVVEVRDHAEARTGPGRIAVAVGWPQGGASLSASRVVQIDMTDGRSRGYVRQLRPA